MHPVSPIGRDAIRDVGRDRHPIAAAAIPVIVSAKTVRA